MDIETPPEWRKGQTIFNFLEWLRTEKNVQTNQNLRMADPFHLSNAQMDKFYKEYMEIYK